MSEKQSASKKLRTEVDHHYEGVPSEHCHQHKEQDDQVPLSLKWSPPSPSTTLRLHNSPTIESPLKSQQQQQQLNVGPWSSHEKHLFLTALQKKGSNICSIAKVIKTRTYRQVCNRYYHYIHMTKKQSASKKLRTEVDHHFYPRVMDEATIIHRERPDVPDPRMLSNSVDGPIFLPRSRDIQSQGLQQPQQHCNSYYAFDRYATGGKSSGGTSCNEVELSKQQELHGAWPVQKRCRFLEGVEKYGNNLSNVASNVMSHSASEADVSSSKKPSEMHETSLPAKPHLLPKRPLSAYDFFFMDERYRILNGPKDTNAHIGDGVAGSGLSQPLDTPDQNLQESNVSDGSKHNATKTVRLADLSMIVAQNWKCLLPSQMEYYDWLSKLDLDRYHREMADYKYWENERMLWKLYPRGPQRAPSAPPYWATRNIYPISSYTNHQESPHDYQSNCGSVAQPYPDHALRPYFSAYDWDRGYVSFPSGPAPYTSNGNALSSNTYPQL